MKIPKQVLKLELACRSYVRLNRAQPPAAAVRTGRIRPWQLVLSDHLLHSRGTHHALDRLFHRRRAGLRHSGRFDDVFNPAIGELSARVALAGADEVNKAVAAAAATSLLRNVSPGCGSTTATPVRISPSISLWFPTVCGARPSRPARLRCCCGTLAAARRKPCRGCMRACMPPGEPAVRRVRF